MEKRRIRGIEYSKRFLKLLRKLPNGVVDKAEIKEKMFKENCFDSRLKTHKLHGREKGAWAFGVDYDYRIKFIFLSNEDLFLDIDSHKIYK